MLNTSVNNTNGEDMTILDDEINELHRKNARVESQMMRLKSDISAMETQLIHGDRVRRFTLANNIWVKNSYGLRIQHIPHRAVNVKSSMIKPKGYNF